MGKEHIGKVAAEQSREALWGAIREQTAFTKTDLACATGLSSDIVAEYVTGLTNAGYLEKSATGPAYRLIKDTGAEAPHVRRDGTQIAKGRDREQMWRTMRILGEFSAPELAAAAQTPEQPVFEDKAASYIKYLHRAGYVNCVRKTKPGVPARYRFINARYTGPKPPRVRRLVQNKRARQVWDANINKVVWPVSDPA